MRKDDVVRLRHMLDAGNEAVSFMDGKSEQDLGESRMLVLSIVKSLEIIGEAASKVSEDTKALYSGIPWSNIVGMRNRLIHAYYDINLAVVWRTVKEDIPPLVAALKDALEGEGH